jgi:phage shock protein C
MRILQPKRFYKIEDKKIISGVCGGVAEYFNIDPSIVRIIWALLAFAYGTGLLAYIVAAVVLQKKSEI